MTSERMSSESAQISERERDILRLVAMGATNQQIANQLNISINTVKVHLRNIFEKIGAASRTEATVYAIRQGLVQLDTPPARAEILATPAATLEAPELAEPLPPPDAVAPPADDVAAFNTGFVAISELPAPVPTSPDTAPPATQPLVGTMPAGQS